MENINYDENNFSAQDFLKQMAIAQQMQAMRPYKTRQDVFSSKSSTPYALEDMLSLRDRIGNASRDLDRDLAQRETFMYSLANALSQMPQQEGPGSWVSALGRGFGAGYAGRTNALVDRAQKRYQAEMKDIEERAALDKMMGNKETSSQHTELGYTPMEYSTGKNDKTQQGNDKAKSITTTENAATTLGDLYKTIDANPQAFSATSGIKQDAISTGLKSGVDVMGVDTIGKREFQYLQSMMPQGFATTINTAKEQEIMRPYTTKFHNGRGSEKKATIKGMLGSIYDAYAADAAAQGFQMPISKEQYIQSRIDAGREINAEWFSKPDTPMYKVNPAVQERQRQQEQTEKNYMNFMEGTI